jgi:sugar phosphate isomerase/epimerase
MNQIKIGTCIPGGNLLKWLPGFLNYGFETYSINFHMQFGDTDIAELAPRAMELISQSPAEFSTLGLYCNPLQYKEHFDNLVLCIKTAKDFGCSMVSTFAGALEGEPVEAAIPKFKEVFGELVKIASDNGITLSIENCPMRGTMQKATCNIGFNPVAWEWMFDAVPEGWGLEWEPTHQMTQLIDPMAQLKKWLPYITHIHGKDATIDYDAIKRYGILSDKPLVLHRTPGFGDCNWTDIISILRQGGYDNSIDIEGYHDPIYKDEWEFTGQLHALEYLKKCRGGDFIANPWK